MKVYVGPIVCCMCVLYYAHVKIILIYYNAVYQQRIFFNPLFFFYSRYSEL